MARKNNKQKYKREHQQAVKDYEAYTKKKEEKRERRKNKEMEKQKTFKEKVEERRHQRGRLPVKHAPPVINSKIKKDKLVEQFKQLKLDRLALMEKQEATIESMKQQDDEMDEVQEEQDMDMKQEKHKSKKRGKAYRKMVKAALKRACKAPILIRRKMEVD